jgi:hypothetical protein
MQSDVAGGPRRWVCSGLCIFTASDIIGRACVCACVCVRRLDDSGDAATARKLKAAVATNYAVVFRSVFRCLSGAG